MVETEKMCMTMVHSAKLICQLLFKSWNQLDGEYCFSFMESMPGIIQAVIKASNKVLIAMFLLMISKCLSPLDLEENIYR